MQIINLKRKLVECLLYEIFEKFKEDLVFDKKYKSKKNEINVDIETLNKIKESVELTNFDANKRIKDNAKQFNKLLMVIEFLKMKISYYLLMI